jgi:two-component system NtrC family sensor kinase
MKFKDLKISTKQKIVFGILLFLLISAVFQTYHVLKSLKNELDKVTLNRLPRVVAISDLNFNTHELRLNQLQYAITTENELRKEQADRMIELINQINDNFDTYEKLNKESEETNLYGTELLNLIDQFEGKWEEYQDLSMIFFSLSREKKTTEAVDLLNYKAKDVFDDFSSALIKLVKLDQQEALEAAKKAEISFHSTRFITTILILCAIVLSILMIGAVVRYITYPIQQLEKAAKTVAEGDLNVKIAVESKDEIGSLAISFNQMTESLKEATEKMQRQAATLKTQNEKLQLTSIQLEEKSEILEKQKAEILQKNLDLYSTMEELKSTQEQLIIKEKMASLGNLVAGVAHEVNTPIGAVHSAADVIKRCIDIIRKTLNSVHSLEEVRNDKQFQNSLKLLQDNNQVTTIASERITKIVKSLRTFARLDESEFQKTNIHEGIENTLTLIHHQIKNRIVVIKEYGDIPEINGYPNQLNQVFMNILVNAAQAIDEKGTITIKTRKDVSNIYIEFSDTGKGIPQEDLTKIFDPGFTTKGVGVGTGLGLAISYNIINKHKGDINVISDEGKGTTFIIRLPQNLKSNH